MVFNGANCDLYMGKEAGKKLLEDVINAKSSVKVVSPFLSSQLIDELVNLSKKDVDVSLITTDHMDKYSRKAIRRVLVQKQSINLKAVESIEKWSSISKGLCYFGIGLLVSLSGLFYYLPNFNLAYAAMPLIILFVFYFFLNRKIKNKRVYTYRYSPLFPVKVYFSPFSKEFSDTPIHGKVYLIDDKIAYMGSLDFTNGGIKHNYETRIKTTDQGAIEKIKEEIDELLNLSTVPEIDLQHWGRSLYKEPLN